MEWSCMGFVRVGIMRWSRGVYSIVLYEFPLYRCGAAIRRIF